MCWWGLGWCVVQVVAAAGLVKKHNQHLLRALASEKETRAMLQMEARTHTM